MKKFKKFKILKQLTVVARHERRRGTKLLPLGRGAPQESPGVLEARQRPGRERRGSQVPELHEMSGGCCFPFLFFFSFSFFSSFCLFSEHPRQLLLGLREGLFVPGVVVEVPEDGEPEPGGVGAREAGWGRARKRRRRRRFWRRRRGRGRATSVIVADCRSDDDDGSFSPP